MNPWYYQDKPVLSLENCPESAIGFIYKITNLLDSRIYIGKKALTHRKKTRISKREKATTKTRKTFKVTATDSKWTSYWGSCKPLLEDIKLSGEHNFRKEIILFCFDKQSLTYQEVRHQILYGVLENDTYNSNILSRFFRPKAT